MNKNFAFVDNIPFTIAAGDTLSLPAGSWDYLYMAELSGGDLLVSGDGFRVPFVLGRQIRVKNPEVRTITLANRGSTSASGVIYVGSGDIEDRATVGSVRVVGVVSVDSVPSSEYDTYTKSVVASATGSQYAALALHNPAANTKDLHVLEIYQRNLTSGYNMVKLAKNTNMESVGGSSVFAEITNRGEERSSSGKLITYAGGSQLVSSLTKDADQTLFYTTGTVNERLVLTKPVILKPGDTIYHQTAVVSGYITSTFVFEERESE